MFYFHYYSYFIFLFLKIISLEILYNARAQKVNYIPFLRTNSTENQKVRCSNISLKFHPNSFVLKVFILSAPCSQSFYLIPVVHLITSRNESNHSSFVRKLNDCVGGMDRNAINSAEVCTEEGLIHTLLVMSIRAKERCDFVNDLLKNYFNQRQMGRDSPSRVSFVNILLGMIVLKAELKSRKVILTYLPFFSREANAVWRAVAIIYSIDLFALYVKWY